MPNDDPLEPTRADLPPIEGGEATRRLDPVDPTSAAPAPSAVRERRVVDDEGDRRRAWWLWALLAAVLIGIVLFALLQDDEDDVEATGDAATNTSLPAEEGIEDPAASAPDDALAEEGDDGVAPAPAETPAPEGDMGEGDGGDGAVPEPAPAETTLAAADGTDVLGLLQGDDGDAERLAPHEGTDVVGTGLEVLDVVDGEGFWIGDDQRRIFAHTTDGADTTVEVGQRIDVEGALVANPPAGATDAHDLPAEHGADLYRQQGHHLELQSITPV